MKDGIDRAVIDEKIKKILMDRLGLENGDIKGTSLLADDLCLDSFDALRVIFEVEDEFDISVPPTEVLHIKSVNDIVDYIEKRLSS